MTIITLLLLLNPAAVAAIWLGSDREAGGDGAVARITSVAVPASLLLAVAILGSRPVLDMLDISDPTFRIAAGALAIFGACQAFLGFGLRQRFSTRGWMIAGHLVWLLSPPVVAVAAAISIDDGVATGLAAGIGFVVLTVAAGHAWAMRVGDRLTVVLGAARRALAAGALFGGVDLIRQGVLSI